MADNIIIKITTEADLTAAQKQLKDMESAAYDLTKQMADLKKAEAEELKALEAKRKEQDETVKQLKDLISTMSKVGSSYEDNVKKLKDEEDALADINNQIDAARKKHKELIMAKQDEIKANKQSINEYNKQIKSYKLLQGEGGKMVQQLRAMREELQRMEDNGEFGTKAFMDLAIAAGQLEDQIGDTQQRIRILSSDTKQMDALIGLGDGLAGGFYVATSAAEVFGNDLEGLQQAFYKVQAAMSAISGAQQVFNALQKDSVVAVVYGNALEKTRQKLLDKAKAKEAAYNAQKAAGVGITKLWTAAQWKLNAAMAANPIGVVIAALMAGIAVIYGAVKAYQSLFTAAGKANRELRKSSKQLEKEQAEIAVGQAKREYDRQQQIKATSDAQEQALLEAQKRHASEVEMAQIKLKYAKQSKEDTIKYADEEIKRGKEEMALLEKRVRAQKTIVESTRENSNKQKKERQKLAELEQEYYDAMQKVADLQTEVTEATQNEAQAVLELSEARRQLRIELQQANIQKDKNMLNLLDQGIKTEDMYSEQINLAKKIAQDEAQAQIDALILVAGEEDKYYAEKERIERELAKTLRDIDEQEIQRANENAKRKTEIAVMEAEAATRALKGDEGVNQQLQVWANYYSEREKQLEENAKHEIEAINRSTDTIEVKDQKVKQIEKQLQADLEAIRKEGAEKALDIDAQYLDELQRNVEEAERATEKAQGSGKLKALEDRFEAEQDLYQAQQDHLDAQYAAGTITYQDYENQRWEITKATEDSIANYRLEKMQVVLDGFNTALGYMQDVSDMAFEAISSNIQAQMDALDEMYTTDAQEAKENANKKYISEKELAAKKAALEQKQARYNKAQALIQAAINTALAITAAMPNWIEVGMASAMGIAQIGIIAAKPIAQYAKGSKGGKGEYALVGEKGPEIMYVPAGASIVPNHYMGDMDAWSKFGVPALPNDMMSAAMLQQINIDYDRLGKAVAANIPQQKAVSVNVDRNGVTISDNGNRRTYLNHKYSGSWS